MAQLIGERKANERSRRWREQGAGTDPGAASLMERSGEIVYLRYERH